MIILKKFLLLFLYPTLERKGKLFYWFRMKVENYLIFQPSRLRAIRIKRGLLKKINPQRFINSDGIKLYAWFVKPKGRNPVILYLHGQAESILTHQDIALYCLEKEYGLFMLSYRGHYKSGGTATEKGVYQDAQDAIMHLKKLGVDEDKIIIWGHSLGSVIAIETAINNNVSGLVLQSPIKEIKSAAIDLNNFYFKRMHFHLIAYVSRLHIKQLNFIQTMDGIGKIKNVQCPIFITHSKTDRIAPFKNALDLAQQNSNTKTYISETGNHWNANWCIEEVFEFIKSLEYNNQGKISKNKAKSEI